jgi:type I restriction enzyme, S subunit
MREDWIDIELGEIAKIYNGNSINARLKEEKYKVCNTGLNYIGTKDVAFDGNIEYENGVKIPFDEPKFKIAPKGSVLVCSEGGSAGRKTGYIEEDVCFGNKLYAITNEYSVFEGKYVYYYTRYRKFFKEFKNQLNGIIGGVSAKKFSNIKVELSPLPEQRAIVAKIEELFSDLDKGIADFKKAQSQLKVYRQAVLKKAFEGELTKEWREQRKDLPSAAELLEKIKIGRQEFFNKQIEEWEFELRKWKEEGENGKKPKKPRPLTVPDLPNSGHEERKWDIPKNWIWTQIGDLCFVTKLAGFEYTDYVNYVEDGDLPVLKAENAGPNGFKKTDYSKVKSESVRMLTRSQIFGGELLVVFVGAGTGNVAMVPLNQRYFLGPNIGMARPYFKLDSRFLEMFLQSAYGKNLMMSAVKAVAQPSLSMGTIRQAPVVFPSHEEQHQIVQKIETRLSVCDKVEESITESLEKAKALRQSILKKAFEGRLLSVDEIEKCKTAPDYEPAKVLLEKIKMKQ